MSLTLNTNPVGTDSSKFFAGFQPCEFVFKREDLAITSVSSGVGSNALITVGTDLTTYLEAGDTIYLYSEATDYIYDGVFKILTITSTEITVDAPYIQTGAGGYINYFKNYYVEMQCVNPDLSDVNLLPFSLQSDGDAAGNVIIDVSIINQLNQQRGDIQEAFLSDSVTEFEVKYRQVYEGSSESFTLVDGKLLIMLYAIDEPTENEVLNQLDEPHIYLGYEAAIVLALKERGVSDTFELTYNELDINKNIIGSDTLGELDANTNGFFSWLWASSASVEAQTKYIEFTFAVVGIYDFAEPDFATPDFVTS